MIWVTGVAGFMGRHLLPFLTGEEVLGLDRRSLDVGSVDAVAAVAREHPPEGVIHLVGLYPPASLSELYAANVLPTMSLLLGLQAAGVKCRVLSIGSAAEYAMPAPEPLHEGSPLGGRSPYGQAKLAQTCTLFEAGRQLGIETLVARPFNLVGAGLSEKLVLAALARQYRDGAEEVVLGNTKAARDFVDVRDVARALVPLLRQGEPYTAYNLCSGRGTTVAELCELLAEVSGRSPRLRVDPARLRPDDPPVVVGDYSRVHALLGWEPEISLRESVQSVLSSS